MEHPLTVVTCARCRRNVDSLCTWLALFAIVLRAPFVLSLCAWGIPTVVCWHGLRIGVGEQIRQMTPHATVPLQAVSNSIVVTENRSFA